MIERELCVVMTTEEFNEKMKNAEPYPEKAPYAPGDMCYYNGKWWIATENTSVFPHSPRGWKVVIVQN
jgi:hypothetical protein